MNTTSEPPKPPPEKVKDLDRISKTSPVTPVDRSAANLERLYHAERDGRKGDQFYFTLAITVLVNGYIAPVVGYAFVLLFLLQVAALLGLAKRLEVSTIIVPFDRIFNRLLRGAKEDGKEEG